MGPPVGGQRIHRSNSRLPTTLNARDQPPAEVSDQRVSGLTGAVQESGDLSHTELGTLQAYVAALGGHLRIVAEFGENTVELTA